MQATRQQILDFLRRHGEATVRELAGHLELTATGVRQHLTVLERGALIGSREERGRVGRPALVYSLTALGEASYPMSYDVLANAVLDEVRDAYGAAGFQQVIRGAAVRMSEPYASALDGLPPERRVAAACDLLRERDVVADWERDGDAFLLRQRSCPYPDVARRNSAACVLDVAQISALTGMDARLTECRVRGDRCCTYRLEPARRRAP